MSTLPDSVLIDPAQVEALAAAGPVVFIDTRDPAAFAAGHIPGAVNLRDIFTYLATSTADGLEALTGTFAKAFGDAGLSGAETAVFYEESMNSGFGQSCRGYVLLQHLGYPKAKVLHGGFAAWKAAGLPVSTEPTMPAPATFPLAPDRSGVLIDAQAMLAALDDAAIAKLDVRDVDEWIGTSSSPYGVDFCPRKGRIPGAVWLEWYRMMKPSADGPRFKSGPEILAECATAGITPDTPVYLYCFKGARASNTLVALKEAGIKDVKLYFASWNEWSRDPALPVDDGFPGVAKPAAAPAAVAA